MSSSSVAFPALGTTAIVAVTDPHQLGRARAVVDAQITICDRVCSRFREDSELSSLNAAAGRTVPVSSRLVEELGAALRAARLTDGAVDPTIGASLVSIGYDRDFPLIAGGSSHPVVFRPVAGWRGLHLDRHRSRAGVPAGVAVDLGATAKARCADLAAQAAADATRCGVLVSLGGDVALAGLAPDGGWQVRVADDSETGASGPAQMVNIFTGGLATSGVTVRRWRRAGRDLHHLIDPRTGAPASVVWRTVTVAAATCTDANIASTAAVVLGHQAPAWLDARHLPARLVTADGTVERVGGWPSDTAADNQRVASGVAS
jgi:thiamine biosynthesis lipoprotein